MINDSSSRSAGEALLLFVFSAVGECLSLSLRARHASSEGPQRLQPGTRAG